MARSDSSHREWRVRVQRPVEIDTRVAKAKVVLLGRVDRDPHMTGFPGVAVAPGNVLKDVPTGKRRHGLTHLAVQDVLGFAVGRVLQLGRIQLVEMTKRPTVQVDEELVHLQGVNQGSSGYVFWGVIEYGYTPILRI